MNSITSTRASSDTLRLLIVEDQEWVRAGLSISLQEKGTGLIIDQAENAEQAINLAESNSPDVILMDIGLPDTDGITITKDIKQRHPEIKIIMLTSHQDEDMVYSALAAGAHAYCMKDIDVDALIQVIRTVYAGAIWIDPKIAKLIHQFSAAKISDTAPPDAQSKRSEKQLLSKRELEVLALMVQGKNNREIAENLFITLNTTKIHVSNIIQKLEVDDRTQVVIKALQEKIVSLKKPDSSDMH